MRIVKSLAVLTVILLLFTSCGVSESALDTARSEGYHSGYDDGYNDGYYSGYEIGEINGYDSGYYNGSQDGEEEGYDSAYYDGYYDGYDECYQDFREIIYDDAEGYACKSGCHPEDALSIIAAYEGDLTYWDGPLPTRAEYQEAIESLYYFYEYFYGEYFLEE